MFYTLLIIAAIFFVTHVVLLFTAFPQSKLAHKRYFYSHLTLWFTGVAIFILALLYGGTGQSSFLDYFNTPLKALTILAFTMVLSLIAHLIVRLLILPLMLSKEKS